MTSKYEDIINNTRPASKHPQMSMDNRAAQFGSFQALSGHSEDVIKQNIESFLEVENEIEKVKNPEIDVSNIDKEFDI